MGRRPEMFPMLIERTAVDLCQALDATVGRLTQAVPAQAGSDPTVADAAKALASKLHLRQAAWGPAEGST